MRPFFRLYFTNLWWFLGTNLFMLLTVVFFWGWLFPESLMTAWNRFAVFTRAITPLAELILAVAIFSKLASLVSGSKKKKSGSHGGG